MEDSIQGQRPTVANNTNNPENNTTVVQVNWLKFVFYSWKHISILNRFVIIFSVMLVISQIATAITILIISSHDSCDQPLQTFIIVYAARIAISCPFHVAEHFRRAERRMAIERRQAQEIRRQEQLRLDRQRRQQRRHQPIREPSNISVTSATSTIMQPRSNWFFSCGEKLKLIMDLFAVLWFIVGNYLLFISQTCKQDSPKLFYTTLAFVLVGYLHAILPLLLYVSVILCLPCVIRVLRDLNLSDLEDANKDSRKEEISKIPVFRYKSSSSESQEQTTVPVKAIKHGFLPKILKRYRHHEIDDLENNAVYEEMTFASEEDAVCCICLSEYENNDLISKLWCGHHFHRACVTDWLQLNRNCPLCKQDFRGKEYEDDSVDEEADLGESSRNGNEFQMAQITNNR